MEPLGKNERNTWTIINNIFFIRNEVMNQFEQENCVTPITYTNNNQSQYRHILPRSPLQQLILNQRF